MKWQLIIYSPIQFLFVCWTITASPNFFLFYLFVVVVFLFVSFVLFFQNLSLSLCFSLFILSVVVSLWQSNNRIPSTHKDMYIVRPNNTHHNNLFQKTPKNKRKPSLAFHFSSISWYKNTQARTSALAKIHMV